MSENKDHDADPALIGPASTSELKAQLKAARRAERQDQGWLRRNRLWVIIAGGLLFAVAVIAALAALDGPSKPNYDALAKMESSDFKTIEQRDWIGIAKSPDNHVDKKIIVFAEVTQFDVSTGEGSFRGNASAVQPAEAYEFDSNTIFQGDPKLLADLGEDDIVKVHGVVAGSTRYDTAIGGTATATIIHVAKVEDVGFADLTEDVTILERSKPDEWGESKVKVQVTNSGVKAKTYSFEVVARSKSGNDELGTAYFSTSSLQPGETVTLTERGLYDVTEGAELVVKEVMRY